MSRVGGGISFTESQPKSRAIHEAERKFAKLFDEDCYRLFMLRVMGEFSMIPLLFNRTHCDVSIPSLMVNPCITLCKVYVPIAINDDY